MSIPIYMDHNVHGAITRGLRRKGFDVLTAEQDNRPRESDPALLSRAHELRRVFFTHDRDLLAEAHRRQLANERFSGVVYAHELRITVAQGIEGLGLICEILQLEEVADRVFYLPL